MPLDQSRTRHAPVKARAPSDPGRLGLAGPHLNGGVDRHGERNRSSACGLSTLFASQVNRPGQGSRSPEDSLSRRSLASRCAACPPGKMPLANLLQPTLLSRVTQRNTLFPGSGAHAPPTAASGPRLLPGGSLALHVDRATAALDGHCWQLQPWMAGQLAPRRPTGAESPPQMGCPVSRTRPHAGVLDLT